MKKYDSYKDSGIDWIGEIPEHWEVVRGDGLFKLKKNLIKKNDLDNLFVYHYSIPSIQEYGEPLLEDGSTIDSDKYEVEGNEILFSKLNPRKGTICLSIIQDKPAVASTEFVILETIENETKFFLYFLSSEGFRSYISSLVESATKSHQRANPSDIYKSKMLLPPYSEQSAIVTYLDHKTSEIDELIADKKSLLNLYAEEKTAIINQAVTKGINPDVKMKDSGIEWLGEIPEHWEVKRLKHVLESVVGGGTPSTMNRLYWDGNIPWVSAKDMKKDQIFSSQDYITELAVNESSTNYFEDKRVIIVVRSGILKHTFPISINKVPISINQDLKALKPRDIIILKFLFWKLRGHERDILTFCNKIGATVDSIDMLDFMNFPFTFPATDEQQSIVNYIEAESARIDAKISQTEKLIDLLTEYRTALISEVVTGKVKVDTL